MAKLPDCEGCGAKWERYGDGGGMISRHPSDCPSQPLARLEPQAMREELEKLSPSLKVARTFYY